jgi:hypothetical protein
MAAKKKSRKTKKAKAAKPAKTKKPVKAKKVATARKTKKSAKPAKAKKTTKAKKVVRAKKPVKRTKRASPLEGEGGHTAPRDYGKGTGQFTAKNKSKISRMAHDAEAVLEGPEGGELHTAKSEGQSKTHS